MITLEDARILLKQAVETKGRDFVYDGFNGCSYTPNELNDTPCLVGVALELAGEFRQRGDDYREFGIRSMVQALPDMMTDQARDYFNIAQQRQDMNCTWGQAYDGAERWYHALNG